jgi:hypothetical protein
MLVVDIEKAADVEFRMKKENKWNFIGNVNEMHCCYFVTVCVRELES